MIIVNHNIFTYLELFRKIYTKIDTIYRCTFRIYMESTPLVLDKINNLTKIYLNTIGIVSIEYQKLYFINIGLGFKKNNMFVLNWAVEIFL